MKRTSKKRKIRRTRKEKATAEERQEVVERVKVRRGSQLDFTEMKEGGVAKFDLNGTPVKLKIVKCKKCRKNGVASTLVRGWIIHRANLRPNYSGRAQFNPSAYCMEEDGKL